MRSCASTRTPANASGISRPIHHDIWDYDLPAPPVLLDVTVKGRKIPAVAQVTKTGFTFVFDRVTGKPVWPIVERKVPQTDVPGERTAATQPFPTLPAPFEPQGLRDEDLIDFTPALKQEALEIVRRYRYGALYTPPSVVTATNLGTLLRPEPFGRSELGRCGGRSRDWPASTSAACRPSVRWG